MSETSQSSSSTQAPAPKLPQNPVLLWFAHFANALERRDVDAATAMFGEECYWRDMLAFTWNVRTSEGRPAIRDMLQAQLDHVAPRGWRIDGAPFENEEGWHEGWLGFETAAGSVKAHVRVVDGKAWTLFTMLGQLRDHPPAIGHNRPRGQIHGPQRGRKPVPVKAQAERDAIGREVDPYVVIIGGGQGGMSLGARLKQLSVPYVILEANAKAGDSWRNRYPSLCLHDPVWYDHMPFIQFPPDWPVFTPRDQVADWLEMYARVMGLNYWTSSRVVGAAYDDARAQWDIEVSRSDPGSSHGSGSGPLSGGPLSGQSIPLRASHLVFATGMSGYPNVPKFKGADRFAGPQVHSSKYQGGADYTGKRCVVIGSNTSAHDICQDLWEQGAASVTMVQRSGTLVAQTDTVLECMLKGLYSEEATERGIDTETADRFALTWPHRLTERRMKAVCATMRERDTELHRQLERVGFLLDFGPDETGLPMKSIRQGGGFYINVGASELICSGEVQLRAGHGIDELTERAVILDDGSAIEADAIIYATGYRSMNEFVADVVGRDVAEAVGKCWGVGSGIAKDPGPWEGELKNMWKPTAHPALWFQGGNFAQARQFSLFLALQLKARMENVPVQVWRG